jgi:hypothetical protein
METFTFDFRNSMNRAFSGRRLLTTRLGYFCMGPGDSKPGDWVMVARGLNMPIVVRRKPNERAIAMVGPAYDHGIVSKLMGDKVTRTTGLLRGVSHGSSRPVCCTLSCLRHLLTLLPIAFR